MRVFRAAQMGSSVKSWREMTRGSRYLVCCSGASPLINRGRSNPRGDEEPRRANAAEQDASPIPFKRICHELGASLDLLGV